VRFPSSGGLITYLIEGFGYGRLVGIACWLGYIAAIVIVGAMIAVSFGGYATRDQSLLVAVVLTAFAVFIVVTILNINTDLLAFGNYPSLSKIVASVALTFFAYLGFNVITFTAGDPI
jgi:hypothetical protein